MNRQNNILKTIKPKDELDNVNINDAESMKKWYESKLEEISEEKEKLIRIETKSDFESNSDKKIETKLEKNITIQTKLRSDNKRSSRVTKNKYKETRNENFNKDKQEKLNYNSKKESGNKKLNIIKNVKTLNKVKDKAINIGKNIQTATNSERFNKKIN